jgi:histidinol-phosphate aminotransferase
MPLLPRENISLIKKSYHGGPEYTELESLGLSPGNIIDFSSNLNAEMPSLKIEDISDGLSLNRYPDAESTALRRAIAEKTGLSLDNIIAGNGSTELIRLAASAYLGTKDSALIIEPTYSEYRTVSEIAGAKVICQQLSETNGFEPDADMTVRLIKDNNPKVIFLCNPNNPSGRYLDRESFRKILRAAADSLVILDEAYISFIKRAWLSTEMIDEGNLLVIRSMTKDYSLAGLRLGYAAANCEIIDVISRICPPWNVNAVAQATGMIALQQEEALQSSLAAINDGKRYLVRELSNSGFYCLPSETNFFLIKVGDAAEIRKKLLKKSILVRDCSSFGLPSYIRIATNTMENNRKLVSALKEIAEER